MDDIDRIIDEGFWDDIKSAAGKVGQQFKAGYEQETKRQIAKKLKDMGRSPEEIEKLLGTPSPEQRTKEAPEKPAGDNVTTTAAAPAKPAMSKEAEALAAGGTKLDVDAYFKGTPKKGELSIDTAVRYGNEKSFYGTFDGRELVVKVNPDRISMYAKGSVVPAGSAKVGSAYGDPLRELDMAYRLAKRNSEKLAAAEEEYAAGKAINRLRRLTDLVARMQKGEKRKVNFQVGGKLVPIEVAVVESTVNTLLDAGDVTTDEAVSILGKVMLT